MDTGFVGLGGMGRPMARSLHAAGHGVRAWNRTRARAEELARDGDATVAATPADAARAGVVVTMVADDAALEQVTWGPEGVIAGLPKGGVHVSMSTVGLATIERLARAHAEAGQLLVAAPVFGRPEAAAARQLSVVAAGPDAAVARVRPLLEAMGQRVFALGAEPSHALAVKLAGNFLITAAIEALAEGMAVVAKAGVDRARLLEVLVETLFGAPVYRVYGRILVEERYAPPGFALPLGVKDNRLLLQAGERLAVPLPLASLVRDRMLAALARGYGDLDWSSFARVSAEDAGLARGPIPRGA
ncbi:MAG TPA: NAD(P)-dependent oxidoreductase [Anaeromyxobacter sp.]|jgi:3-hydroxyisobutyrate dehydrogenase-like beta-hydroxyacid dehydrogenase|nr:NAD(P)-dependent oxidoreductase [Anaeromyxobacter sp.]